MRAGGNRRRNDVVETLPPPCVRGECGWFLCGVEMAATGRQQLDNRARLVDFFVVVMGPTRPMWLRLSRRESCDAGVGVWVSEDEGRCSEGRGCGRTKCSFAALLGGTEAENAGDAAK